MVHFCCRIECLSRKRFSRIIAAFLALLDAWRVTSWPLVLRWLGAFYGGRTGQRPPFLSANWEQERDVQFSPLVRTFKLLLFTFLRVEKMPRETFFFFEYFTFFFFSTTFFPVFRRYQFGVMGNNYRGKSLHVWWRKGKRGKGEEKKKTRQVKKLSLPSPLNI